MKTISNRTHRPIRIPLPGGKFLHLGPAKSGQISEKAAARPAVQKLVTAGEVEILEGNANPQSGSGNQGPAPEAHGHPQTTVVLPKGNR